MSWGETLENGMAADGDFFLNVRVQEATVNQIRNSLLAVLEVAPQSNKQGSENPVLL